MKKQTMLFWSILAVMIFSFSSVERARAQLQDAIEELTGENSKGYLQPFFNCFANNLNSGIYSSAAIPRVGLRFRISLVAMGTNIGDEDRVYMGVPPQPYNQTPVETATVFGSEGAVVSGPGVSYRFQDGQITTGDFFPFAIPQVEVGSFLGTLVRVRYVPPFKISGKAGDEIGEIKLLGYGLQHSLSQYIFMCPVDISAGFFYQTFDVGDIMKCKTMSYGVQVSKSFAALTLFGGGSFESGKMNVSYDYQGEENAEKIEYELKSKTSFRFHVGASLGVPGFHLNGAVYLGPQMSTAVGLGLGL